MNRLYAWFYCLPIPAALFLVGGLTAAYVTLKRRYGTAGEWRLAAFLLLCVSSLLIAGVTLIDRHPGDLPLEPVLAPFQSYRTVLAGGSKELLRGNLMNVILFYPAGLFACALLPERWNGVIKVLLVTLLAAAASVGIEYCQYRFALGQAELDDVIHNTLGGWIGAVIGAIYIKV